MTLLADHVSRHATLRPDAEAVTDGTLGLSYAELDAQANRIAHCLRAQGVGREDLVLVSMRRSAHFLASIIGTLRAGAAYVPLEARTPAARRRQIIADCGPRAVICDAATAAQLAADEALAGPGTAMVVVDAEPAELEGLRGPVIGQQALAAADESAPPCDGSPDDLACVLYTSGSTGSPKGVMVSQRNVDEYASWAVERIGIGAEDRVLGTAPFYFDMSLFDIYCSLRAGGTLCIATERVLLFPKTLLAFAEQQRVTVWKGVSSLLMYLSTTGALSPERIPTLRVLLFGGEALAAKYLIDWMQTFPDKAYYNFYGPTEATGASLYHRVPHAPASADEKIPIGIPCENTELQLLDEERRPVQPGEIGEVALGGVCLCRGYLNDPAKTASVFVDDPRRPATRIYLTGDYARQRADGTYELIGRRDNQIKFMGYRLELDDIESALTAIEGVDEAAVLLGAPARAGVAELVGYVVLGADKSAAAVQAELKHNLPFYMVPRHIYPIERLPRSDRGKLDRQALAAYHRERRSPG